MGERWGTRCFPAFSSFSLPQKTRENSRRKAEKVCEFFVLPLENTRKHKKNAMFSHRKTAVNKGLRFVFHVLTECLLCILHALAAR